MRAAKSSPPAHDKREENVNGGVRRSQWYAEETIVRTTYLRWLKYKIYTYFELKLYRTKVKSNCPICIYCTTLRTEINSVMEKKAFVGMYSNYRSADILVKISDNPALDTLIKKPILVTWVKDVQGGHIGNWLGSKTVTLVKVFKPITSVLEVCKDHMGVPSKLSKLGVESDVGGWGGGG